MFFTGRNRPGVLLTAVLKNSTKEWKQKVKEKNRIHHHSPKQNVRHQKNLSLCFPREKSKPLECCLTLFSNQIRKESGSSAISPLENYPEAPSGQQRLRPLDSRSPGSPWASHPDVIGSCLPVPSRAPGEFLQKSFHTHAQEIKEDAIDLPMPSLTLPVLTVALNERLKLNYFIKVCLQS